MEDYMFWPIVLFILGLAIIIKGGDWFVEAAVWVAEITGVPKLLIGATIVSLATTLPELFVSIFAVTSGSQELGVGNAIGSVICNTGLILALSIAIRPSTVDKELFYKKAAIMVLSLAALFVFSLDGTLTWLESIPLVVLLGLFIFLNVRHARRSMLEAQKQVRHIDTNRKSTLINVAKFILGAAGIVVGAQLLVNNGVKIAAALGVSEGIIGVTVVALGTSLPELVTTLTALRKKEAALGIGNILGANILNITLILSMCGIISPNGLSVGEDTIIFGTKSISRTLFLDTPVAALLFAMLIIVPVLLKGKLKRLQGILMLAVYVGFIALLVIKA